MIKFSVIVPNYNHAAFLKQRIDTILQQTYPLYELILLDDCSTDGSKEIIESYRQHPSVSHIIYNTKNSGSPFHQWKKGIEMAGGDWIWIAESDDMADLSFLSQLSNVIGKYPSAGVCYCDSYTINADGTNSLQRFSQRKNDLFSTNKWSADYYRGGTDEINESLKFDCTINNASSVVFKKVLAKDALKDLDTYMYYGDWYFFLQLNFAGDTCYCHQPLNYYRKHENSLLNAPTSLTISKKEYFNILSLLYYSNSVTDKSKLLSHFAFYYLNVGLLKDGPVKVLQLLTMYARLDKQIFFKLLPKLVTARFRAKQKEMVAPGETTHHQH